MPALTVIEFNGKEHRIDAEVGKSAMQVVIDAMVPGIMADCGGACSCATCHCYVEEPWVARLPEPVPRRARDARVRARPAAQQPPVVPDPHHAAHRRAGDPPAAVAGLTQAHPPRH